VSIEILSNEISNTPLTNDLNHSPDLDAKALDELFYEVGVYNNGKDLKSLFEFIKRFPKIAPFNAMLLHIQKPGCKYVASVSDWKSKFNRTIKAGVNPLVILWPFAPVHFVYEVSDTEGETFPEELLNPFKTEGNISDKSFKMLLNNLPREAIQYIEADHGTQSAGLIKKNLNNRSQIIGNKQVKILYDLVVNKHHSKEEKFATIIHELGHLFCGHQGTYSEKLWKSRVHLSMQQREFEAESVAWLVCERLGIKNPSAEYLKGYFCEDGQIPQISLETVIKVAGKIETMLSRLSTIKKEIIIQ